MWRESVGVGVCLPFVLLGWWMHPFAHTFLDNHATQFGARRVEAHVERLMEAGKEKEALGLIKRCLEAPWADQQKVW